MNNPLILIVIFYILGIIIGKTVAFPLWFVLLLILFSIGFLLYGIIKNINTHYFFIILFFLIGLLNIQIRNLPPPKDDISNFPNSKYSTIIGRIADEPRFKEDKAFFTLDVEKVNDKNVSGLLSVVSKRSRLEYGDKIDLKGKLEGIDDLTNPGILSYAQYLKNRGIRCRVRSPRAPPKVIGHGGDFFKKLSINLKNRLMLIPQKTLPEPYSTLLSSIVFGTKAAKAPREIKDTYKRAGVAHLLVASGMHLGILVGVCLFLVRSLRLPLWLGILITSAVNIFYALMTGAGPSILRAAIMAEIMLVGLLFEKEKEVYTSMAIAAFLILLFNPKVLFEVGFQLSFAATWALVYVAPVMNERINDKMPKALSSLVSVAIAPVLATVPITLFHFSQTSIVGVLTNILLLPWIGFVVILGFVSTVLGSIFLPLGELINGANLILLWIAHQIVSSLASFPFAMLYLAPPKFPLVIGYYTALVLGAEVVRRGKIPKLNRFRLITLALVVVCVLLWNTALSSPIKGLTITVLDVGQGDSILIEAPSGKKILVDGGEEKMGERIVIAYLQKRGINKLDMVILTHPHEDHVGGLRPLLQKIKVGTVLDPGAPYNTRSYRLFKELIRRNKIKHLTARAGQMISFGKEVRAKILHPMSPFLENINDVSIVFRLRYKDFTMMFTGDNEKEGEEQILARFFPDLLDSDILKVGHHGSRTSTSDYFLDAVNPQIAVISCGRRNKFRHPHKSTLQKLRGRGINIYRTDKHGAVVIKTDGERIRVIVSK
ncbi:MAG: DNA internalization-related competence protein ComEC/Rec2 [Candidatus Margulisiibacteriota bacterium]|nr:DNA internalization-related competence protein ComEC/Rec2 [Candidatus Margulisiibacteriota bacterium]